MKLYQGTVSQIRAFATTTVTSTTSSTRHSTTVKFGPHAMTIKGRSTANVHLGDDLCAYGWVYNGAVMPFLIRNRSNGYEAGLGTKLGFLVSIPFALLMALFGIGSRSVPGAVFAVAMLVLPVVILRMRKTALEAMSHGAATDAGLGTRT